MVAGEKNAAYVADPPLKGLWLTLVQTGRRENCLSLELGGLMGNVIDLHDARVLEALTQRLMVQRELFWERAPKRRSAPELIGARISRKDVFHGRIGCFLSDRTEDVGPCDTERDFWRSARRVVLDTGWDEDVELTGEA
jgi:hypothetical protein